MTTSEHNAAPVEIDATELTFPEWFFLKAAAGHKDDASLRDMMEWRNQSLGMTPVAKQRVFHEGMEALMARGFIRQARDKNGNPVMDQSNPPQPVYEIHGRIVSRTTEFKPKSIN